MKNKILILSSAIVVIFILINILSDDYYFRIDLTKDGNYTLSDATKNMLKNLDQPVTVKAYFSENLPPDIAKARRDFKELLIEYGRVSDGNVVYEFINPNEKEDKEREALENGIQPVMINVREKDQMKQQKAYLGAIVKMGTQKDVIPFMQPGGALEYSLSTSIKKVSVTDKPTLGFLQGHGEPSLQELSQLMAQLSILYDVQPVNVNDTTPIAQNIKTLVIIRPTDSIPMSHLIKIEQYVAGGGKLAIAIQRVKGNLQNATGAALNTGLENYLMSKNIIIDENFVVDAQCGAVTVQQQQGFFNFASQVQFPYFPIITNFADHPVVKGLESVFLPFASEIRYKGDSSIKFVPLAFTSDKSGVNRAPLYFNIEKQWTEGDFPMSKQVVAAALEGNIAGAKTKIVVIANGDFCVSGGRDSRQQLQPDNVNLMANAIDWLSDDTGLITLRTKGASSRPINQMEDSTKSLLKYLNFFIPIALVIGYGVYRSQWRKSQRIRRMEENYVG
ncbi:MAG: Gldg family protein [Cytophagales bacterium]|nr:Gldg family protein [Cytophagales bacterium]